MEAFFNILYFGAFLAIGIGFFCIIDLRKKDKRFKTGYKGNRLYNEELAGFGVRIIMLGGVTLFLLNFFNKTPEDYMVKKLQIPDEVLQAKEKDIWFYKNINAKESLAFTSNSIFTLAYVCLKKEKKDLLLFKVFNNDKGPVKIHFTGDSLDVFISEKYKMDNGFYVFDFKTIEFLTKNKSVRVQFLIDDLNYESMLKLINSKIAINKTMDDCKSKTK